MKIFPCASLWQLASSILPVLIISNTALAADPGVCEQTPTARCLIQDAVERWPAFQQTHPDSGELGEQLAFEAQRFDIPFAAAGQSVARTPITRQLEQEENFLRSLERKEWQSINRQAATMAAPLDDVLAAPAAALQLEALILAVKDQDAASAKRQFYESLIHLPQEARTRNIIAVAEHEILGGAPDRGLQTLSNAGIDDFSGTEAVLAHRTTETLAQRSAQLFLQPDKYSLNCPSAEQIAPALITFITGEEVQAATDPLRFPDTDSQVRILLLLGRLYHNSDACPLLTQWLGALAIQRISSLTSDDPRTFRQKILLARAIRRYLTATPPI